MFTAPPYTLSSSWMTSPACRPMCRRSPPTQRRQHRPPRTGSPGRPSETRPSRRRRGPCPWTAVPSTSMVVERLEHPARTRNHVAETLCEPGRIDDVAEQDDGSPCTWEEGACGVRSRGDQAFRRKPRMTSPTWSTRRRIGSVEWRVTSRLVTPPSAERSPALRTSFGGRNERPVREYQHRSPHLMRPIRPWRG